MNVTKDNQAPIDSAISKQSALKVALVQCCSGKSPAQNLLHIMPMIDEAAKRGAQFIELPEVANICNRQAAEAAATWQYESDDGFLAAMQQAAARLKIWLHIGSLALKNDRSTGPAPNQAPAVNRGIMIDDHGKIQARYDKIHMFDVTLANGEHYQESRLFAAGTDQVLVKSPWGDMGLSICYDVRFPEHYRRMARQGAGLLLVPAAFTHTTGKAHWHVLMRARAIECGSFVLAAAQGGFHEDGRHTYGHSLIVNPWGKIIAEAPGAEPCLVEATLDLTEITQARTMIPAWQKN